SFHSTINCLKFDSRLSASYMISPLKQFAPFLHGTPAYLAVLQWVSPGVYLALVMFNFQAVLVV
ncbi:MAG: hypothetical protein PF482_01800, partial [Desulfobacteraceae bacterium]|nr:hypothetical protein [Desulfobacteraceae bacterium]